MSGRSSTPKSSAHEADVATSGANGRDLPLESITELQQELNRLQRTIRLAIQAKLAQFAGRSMGSLPLNRELAKSLHELLDGHGLRAMCSECGRPAILRVSPRPGSAGGVFVFDHTIDGRRTFHGGKSTMPPLHLVAKPPRQSRRAAG